MITIDYRDPRPIYEQVKQALRRELAAGGIGRDERLPSVRELAARLAINPNTIQRAYRELEAEGSIYSVPGRGSFSAGRACADSARAAELSESLFQTGSELVTLGLSPEDICRGLQSRLTEVKQDYD